MTAASRSFTANELGADRFVHLVGVALGVLGAVVLVWTAAESVRQAVLVSAVTYSICLVAMLSFSAAYNLGRNGPYHVILRRLDHAAIFAMIAGTYTPFTLLGLSGGWRLSLTIAVWSFAAFGIALKLFGPIHESTRISAIFYLALGWMGLIAVGPLLQQLGALPLVLIGIGGCIYSVGVIFHALEKMRYQNAIWHGFVLVAAIVQFAAVFAVVRSS